MRSFALVTAFFAIACRADVPSSSNEDIGHNVDDTGDTAPSASLTVDFTTAWSAAVPFSGTTGEQVNLGALLITSNTDAAVTVSTLAVSLWFDENADGSYRLGKEGGIEASRFVSDCVLTDAVTSAVVAGPISADNGRLVFVDDFTVAGDIATALNVRCTLVDSAPFGETYGVAVDINHASQEVIATVDGGVNLVPVTLGSTNGTQDGLTLTPDVAVLVTYDYCSTTERRLADLDQDGYGDPDNYEQVGVCEAWKDGYVNWIDGRDDCDDTRATIHPDAEETCNSLDDDCDGRNDEGFDYYLAYQDADGDGYGGNDVSAGGCPGTEPDGFVDNNDDCNDKDASVYPGNGC